MASAAMATTMATTTMTSTAATATTTTMATTAMAATTVTTTVIVFPIAVPVGTYYSNVLFRFDYLPLIWSGSLVYIPSKDNIHDSILESLMAQPVIRLVACLDYN